MKQLQLKKKQEEQERQVLSLLMMRFELNPYSAITVAKKWFKTNPEGKWSDLLLMLQQGKIIYKKGILKEIEIEYLVKLVNRIRSKQEGITLKNKWVNFKLYRQSFLGSQAVKWLIEVARLSKAEAIAIGRLLISCGIVTAIEGNYDFEDRDLHYCFYQKSTQLSLEENEVWAF